MENGPGLKMYFLFKMGIFHCYVIVYQRVPHFFAGIKLDANTSCILWIGNTVDASEIRRGVHQLSLVVEIPLFTSQVVIAGRISEPINHMMAPVLPLNLQMSSDENPGLVGVIWGFYPNYIGIIAYTPED